MASLARTLNRSKLGPSVFRNVVALQRRTVATELKTKTQIGEEVQYVPGGPVFKGSVNDPTTFPPPDRTHGSYHWSFERLLSAALVPLTGAAFVTSGSNYPVIDGLLGITLIVHSHVGFDAVLVDYVHKRKFPVIGPASTWALRVATVGVLVGVYQFNTNDIGLTELIAKVWHA